MQEVQTQMHPVRLRAWKAVLNSEEEMQEFPSQQVYLELDALRLQNLLG